jgi:hypothetical protein
MYCNQWNALHAVQVKKFENKSWKAVGGKTYAPVADGYTTSFYVYNEVPYIAYVSKRTTKVNVEKFENGEWQIIENNINNQHISSTSLFIFDNILYLAYESSGNLTVVKYDKNEWKIVGKEIPHVVTYEISVYKHTPYIAYGSFNNKDLITIMRYSTYNPNTEPDPPFLQ